jgi:hypothetical protein
VAKEVAKLPALEKTAAAEYVAEPPLTKKKPSPQNNKSAAAVANHAKPSKKAVVAAAVKEKSSAAAAAAVAAATAVGKLPGAQGTSNDAPSGPEDNQVQKHILLEEKRKRYCYLWRIKKALEEEHKFPPGMLDESFLNVDDAEAAVLEDKIKKHIQAEMQLQLNRFDIKKLVFKLLCDLVMM